MKKHPETEEETVAALKARGVPESQICDVKDHEPKTLAMGIRSKKDIFDLIRKTYLKPVPIVKEGEQIKGKKTKLRKTALNKKVNKSRVSIKKGATVVTNQGVRTFRMDQPYDFVAIKQMRDLNGTHSACINAKTSCTVGLGFVSDQEKDASDTDAEATDQAAILRMITNPTYQPTIESKILDPFCRDTFLVELKKAESDYEEVGVGYLEVVRKNGKIAGISHIPSEFLWPVEIGFNEDPTKVFQYYEYRNYIYEGSVPMAVFGSKDELVELGVVDNVETDEISEVIRFVNPSNRYRYFGDIKWIAAASDIEIGRVSKIEKYNFWENSCMVDFLLLLRAPDERVDPTLITKLEASLSNKAGSGNAHSSVVANIGKAEDSFHRLTHDGDSDEGYLKIIEATKTEIASAHQVPPLLANILIPGKLGASNEFVNALMGFQLLVISQSQHLITNTLRNTLGNTEVSGLDFKYDSAFAFRNILDLIDLEKMTTIGAMRQTLPEAQAEGRDLSAGVKE